MKYKVTPCNYVDGMDLEHEEINVRRLYVLFDHIKQEVAEAQKALEDFAVEGNGKMRTNLGEELVDIMTCCATMLYAIGRITGSPYKFAKMCLKMVRAKVKARGYCSW